MTYAPDAGQRLKRGGTMTESIYWISVDCSDHIPDAEEWEEITNAIDDGLDHHAIITTEEIKPMDETERYNHIKKLTQELEQ